MTEYVAIPESDLEVDDGIKSEHALSWNNNLPAVMELDPTAKAAGIYVPGTWYVEDGAGGTDPFYDFDVDGAVSSVTTPDFEAGYDYRIVFDNLSYDAVDAHLRISLYAAASSAWSTENRVYFLNEADSATLSGTLDLHQPMRVRHSHVYVSLVSPSAASNSAQTGNDIRPRSINRATATAMSRARLTAVFNGGKVWLLKSQAEIF